MLEEMTMGDVMLWSRFYEENTATQQTVDLAKLDIAAALIGTIEK